MLRSYWSDKLSSEPRWNKALFEFFFFFFLIADTIRDVPIPQSYFAHFYPATTLPTLLSVPMAYAYMFFG